MTFMPDRIPIDRLHWRTIGARPCREGDRGGRIGLANTAQGEAGLAPGRGRQGVAQVEDEAACHQVRDSMRIKPRIVLPAGGNDENLCVAKAIPDRFGEGHTLDQPARGLHALGVMDMEMRTGTQQRIDHGQSG